MALAGWGAVVYQEERSGAPLLADMSAQLRYCVVNSMCGGLRRLHGRTQLVLS